MGGRHREALPDGEPRGVLTTAPADGSPARDLAVALARELLHATGALRVSIALDDAALPVVVRCARFEAIVVHGDDGELELPHDAAADLVLPELPLLRQLPPFEVDGATGAVAGVLGGLEMLGRAVRDIAGLLPGASVVAAEFETTDPECPLGLAGRPGEPVVVLLGEHELELNC